MHRGFKILTALTTGLSTTAPAMAQAHEKSKTVTYFKMFFLSEDWIGQLIIVFLFLVSLLTVAYIIKLMVVYRRSTLVPPELYQELNGKIAEKKYPDALQAASQSEAYLAKLVDGAMREAPNGYHAMERAMEELSDIETSRMLRPIEYLNVIGNVSPMLGLFGTVYGMIGAFQAASAAGAGKADTLAKGIYEALVTTAAGLTLAIPVLIVYQVLSNKIDSIVDEVDDIAVDFLEHTGGNESIGKKIPAKRAPAKKTPSRAKAVAATA